MGDSPKSDPISRFSTPVNELDDHRFQPDSLPRADNAVGGPGRHRRQSRRSTGQSQVPHELLQVQEALRQTLALREDENAIADEERSDTGSNRETRQHRASHSSPTVPRRTTFRRPRHREDRADRSRDSSTSSRSQSPANSVDAFAEPRVRARAGTAATNAPSIAPSAYNLRRSISGGTNRPRAVSIDLGKAAGDEKDASEGSVGDDICFPAPEEPRKDRTIDFEDLEEFVEKSNIKTKTSTPIALPFDRRASVVSGPGDVRQRDGRKFSIAPQISPMRRSSDIVDGLKSDSKSDLNEKSLDPVLDLQERIQSNETVNRWAFFSSELEETIFAPDLGDLLMPGETFENLFELGPEGGVWWLDMLMPTEEEVEVVCKAFGVHGLTREDIVQQESREKVELFKSYYFVCFRSFYQMDDKSEYYMEPVNFYAVVFREGILTFTFCPSPHATNVRKRMGKLRDYVALGADWICYALIDDIVDTYGPVIHSVELETDTIEDSVFTARAEDSRMILRQIGECRKRVMSLIRLIGGKADVIKGFAKRCNDQYGVAPRQDVGMYLSDIQDHVVTMMSNLNHFEKMLSRSHSNYLAQISVENIQQGTKANEVLSKVTFIATILVPLNLVCGLFGMNVPVPGVDSTSLGWFFGILGCLVAFVVLSTATAKKLKFI